MRSLRGDNSAQGTGADLNATLTYMTKNMFPGQDCGTIATRWSCRKARLLRISPCCSRFKSFSMRMLGVDRQIIRVTAFLQTDAQGMNP